MKDDHDLVVVWTVDKSLSPNVVLIENMADLEKYNLGPSGQWNGMFIRFSPGFKTRKVRMDELRKSLKETLKEENDNGKRD